MKSENKKGFFDFFKSSEPETENYIPVGSSAIEDENVETVSSPISEGDHEIHNYQFEEHFRTNEELLNKYDQMAQDPYISDALEDVLNEIITHDRGENSVEINLDLLDKSVNKKIKKEITEEFNKILKLLDFHTSGYDLVKDWYIKGQQYFYPIIAADGNGLSDIHLLNARNVKQIKEQKYKDVEENGNIISVKAGEKRFFIYKLGEQDVKSSYGRSHWSSTQHAFKFPYDSIIQVDSGKYDKDKNLILSELHSAIKPYNQLSQSEDAMVIYRMVRAPEKRVFYIDVGNLGHTAAEKYINGFISKFKTKLNYNSNTGKLHAGSKGIQSIFEDFWMPRKGNQNSQIETIDSNQNLGELDDIEYLKRKLYISMKIPETRLDPEVRFSLGRATEIERDEFKFSKRAEKLRTRFSRQLFNPLLKTQLVLKKIIKEEDWNDIAPVISYDWLSDNFYKEVKDQEILLARLEVLSSIENLDGEYFDSEFIHKKILRKTDEEYNDFINKNKEVKKDAEVEED